MSSRMIIEKSGPLNGTAQLYGAKNAVLVIMACLVLTRGKSFLRNVPFSNDVFTMIQLLEDIGAHISFNMHEHILEVDTTTIDRWTVGPHLVKKMRASILLMGPLLARFAKASISFPGGCLLGPRPIDYHLKNFKKMGVIITEKGEFIEAHVSCLQAQRIVLEYPSVGATENILMAAVLTQGTTEIINAALEPEVFDLITVLKKMGARICVVAPATIVITGVTELMPVDHAVIVDRLEAGALLLAAAITGGQIYLPQLPADILDVFLYKLEEMGHSIVVGPDRLGVTLIACSDPQAVSFKTSPYPGFPTDLQAPMMIAQCIANGVSIIEETVFENRLLHVNELQKMGAQIKVAHTTATISGVDNLYGTHVIATDIRASCALMLAGLVAQDTTIMTGLEHWYRGYDGLEKKLTQLGAQIRIVEDTHPEIPHHLLEKSKEYLPTKSSI